MAVAVDLAVTIDQIVITQHECNQFRRDARSKEMCRARLIKRNELTERELVSPQPEAEPIKVKMAVDAVQEWKNNRRAAQQVNPREVFAALFSPRRLTET
jgi:hypothetical protein